MGEFDFSDLGKQIKDSVKEIIDSKEVGDLKVNLKNTAANTAQTVREAVKDAADNVNRSLNMPNVHTPGGNGSYQKQQVVEPKRSPRNMKKRIIGRPVGKAGGVVMLVFGIMGMILGGLGFAASAALELFISTVPWASMAAMGLSVPLFLCSSFLSIKGNILCGRVDRFRIYVRFLEEKGFAAIEQMAEGVKKSKRFVIKELIRMNDRKWFAEGHLDREQTCFMATNETYGLYLETEENAHRKLLEQKEEEKRISEKEEYFNRNPNAREIDALREEGIEYKRQIQEANGSIANVEISKKLDRLELVCGKIFESVQADPAKLPDIRRFMNYYLPTTLKLIHSYHEFDKQPVQGDNITKAKKEIESTLDSINLAFENLFDQLFQEDALDIATDITVLSTMLAQEGLLGNDFEQKEE